MKHNVPKLFPDLRFSPPRMLSPKTSRFQLSNRVIQTERDSELLLRGHGLENTLLLGMHAGSAIH